MKEDFFSKFKDYNKQLEKILEKKDFSKDVKNLLLSMLYKLDISYDDYSQVKKNCKSKQEYLQNILDNIKSCNSIELIKPNDIEFEEIKQKGLYEIDLKLKKIKVFANELSLLSSLLELNNFQIHLKEEYNLIRNTMPYLLNMAYDMENLEVLRDFNAWSWNILVDEIKDININLVYQNLKIALNKNIFSEIEDLNSDDIIENIKQKLLETYSEETINTFLELIFKISILIYINISESERKRLLEEKETLKLELEEIKNKKAYVEKISKEKKELTDKLKQIDLTINNKDMLLEEYEKRNAKLAEYNKIFSISHLVEKLQKEREKVLAKIETCNKKVEPETYLENKNKLQKDFNLLKDIKFESNNNLYKYIDELQKIFVKDILVKRIEKASTSNELIECIYQIRYYNYLPYTKEKIIKDIKEFQVDIGNIQELLIKKLYDNKIINTLSTNEKNDIQIVKNIFDLKIINMEYIYVEIKKEKDKYIINTFDEKETLEQQFEMNLEFNKKDKIKLNRRIKLFA